MSGPASSSSTLRADAADRRFASTHPAAPPPTMMVSKLLPPALAWPSPLMGRLKHAGANEQSGYAFTG
jgi:hypothetical protein